MDRLYPIPSRDPVTGGELIVTELHGPESDITIRGRFEVPRYCRLNPEQLHFLETFLRCRGMLNSVEKELGISYPTVRARLDAVLKALDLYQEREPEPSAPANSGFPESSETESAHEAESNGFEPDAWGPGPEPIPEFETIEPETSNSEPKVQEEETPSPEPVKRWTRLEVLEQLEKGEITPEEAKQRLGVVQ